MNMQNKQCQPNVKGNAFTLACSAALVLATSLTVAPVTQAGSLTPAGHLPCVPLHVNSISVDDAKIIRTGGKKYLAVRIKEKIRNSNSIYYYVPPGRFSSYIVTSIQTGGDVRATYNQQMLDTHLIPGRIRPGDMRTISGTFAGRRILKVPFENSLQLVANITAEMSNPACIGDRNRTYVSSKTSYLFDFRPILSGKAPKLMGRESNFRRTAKPRATNGGAPRPRS